MTKRSWQGYFLLGLWSVLTACATVAEPMVLFEPNTLLQTAQDGNGRHDGVVWLKRHIRTRVEASARASRAESTLRLHCALTRYGDRDRDQHIVIPVLLPPAATLGTLQARVLSPRGIRSVAPIKMGPSERLPRIDPDQQAWEFLFPPLDDGAVLEMLASFNMPGTLVAHSHWLGAYGGPSVELLLRYDVPENAAGALQIRGGGTRPVVTKKDGYTIMAVYLQNVEPLDDGSPHIRYATRSVSHRGSRTPYAASWTFLSTPYVAELLEHSVGLRMKHRAPIAPEGRSLKDAERTFIWVRDRLQTPDAMAVDWKAGQSLPEAITNNTLNGTDKVHLLHWLLSDAGIDHHVAVARSNHYPPIDAAFPSPGAFDRALIYLDDPGLWLDPACRLCTMGEVRPNLQGGQGLLLPGEKGAVPIPISPP